MPRLSAVGISGLQAGEDVKHDHGDHMGDYFEMLKALSDADVPVKTTGQSDMMRSALVPEFRKAGL